MAHRLVISPLIPMPARRRRDATHYATAAVGALALVLSLALVFA